MEKFWCVLAYTQHVRIYGCLPSEEAVEKFTVLLTLSLQNFTQNITYVRNGKKGSTHTHTHTDTHSLRERERERERERQRETEREWF